MSTRFHIAAKELKGAISAYAKRFDLLEVRVALAEGGRGTKAEGVPSLATLRKWRKQVPPHFAFSVVAGPHLSRIKQSAELEAELAGARAAIDALQARCFVLHTPPEVTPSALWRDRIAKVVERVPHDVTSFVWEPSGVWETADAAVLARSLGIVLAVDPAREPVPAGNVAYVRLRALGETRSFGPSALERVVHAIGPRHDAYVVIETDSALQECKRLRRIAQRPRAHEHGGMGRLVRPRGTFVVRDDEQE
jgi:uncharacterized protein YecE (DUF72 family)